MVQTDKNRYFFFVSLEGGTYIAGMNPPGAPLGAGEGVGVKTPVASVYYPSA